MSKIIELTRSEAAKLLRELEVMLDGDRAWRTVKVNIDGDGFKYKIGEGMWTPSLGRVLPGSTGSDTTDYALFMCTDDGRTLIGGLESFEDPDDDTRERCKHCNAYATELMGTVVLDNETADVLKGDVDSLARSRAARIDAQR